MRGQRLFVRPIETSDTSEVRAFLRTYAHRDAVPACGLIGKLVGELVAVLAIDLTAEGVRIEDLVVAPELRRKRVGRVMLDELEALAVKMERDWLIVEDAGGGREFLRHVGFVDDGARMVRRVTR